MYTATSTTVLNHRRILASARVLAGSARQGATDKVGANVYVCFFSVFVQGHRLSPRLYFVKHVLLAGLGSHCFGWYAKFCHSFDLFPRPRTPTGFFAGKRRSRKTTLAVLGL